MSRTCPKNRRLDMILKDTIPAQSEIRKCMGSSMADVFFDYCHPDSKKLLGVISPIEGLHAELCTSPTDHFIQKVAFVPALSSKCMKAFTHQGILVIGQKAMVKYEHNICNKILEKYEEQIRETRDIFQAEKRSAIQLAEQKIRLNYENYIGTLREQFEQKLQSVLTEAFQKCVASMQKAVVRERVKVTRMTLQKLRNEISYMIHSIYGRFEVSLRAEKENMVADFNEIIRQERAKADDKMKEMERNKDEALQALRHELEMRNFADATHVLCLERMRSSAEKHALHLRFKTDRLAG